MNPSIPSIAPIAQSFVVPDNSEISRLRALTESQRLEIQEYQKAITNWKSFWSKQEIRCAEYKTVASRVYNLDDENRRLNVEVQRLQALSAKQNKALLVCDDLAVRERQEASKLQEYTRYINQCNDYKNSATSKIAELRGQIEMLSKENKGLRENLNQAGLLLANNEKRLNVLDRESMEYKGLYTQASNEIKVRTEELRQATQLLQRCNGGLNSEKTIIAKQNQQIIELNSVLDKAKQSMTNYDQNFKLLQQEKQKLTDDAYNLRNNLSQATLTIETLKQENERLKVNDLAIREGLTELNTAKDQAIASSLTCATKLTKTDTELKTLQSLCPQNVINARTISVNSMPSIVPAVVTEYSDIGSGQFTPPASPLTRSIPRSQSQIVQS